MACTNPLASPPPSQRILVIRLGAVGDVVRTLPAVRALRAAHGGAHIAWLVEPPAAGAVELLDGVDEIVVFPRGELVALLRRGRWLAAGRRLAGVARVLRARRFDLCLDFHSILRSAVLARLSGATRRVGLAPPFGRELSWLLATDRAVLFPRRTSRFARNAGLLAYCGVDPAPAALPLPAPPPEPVRAALPRGCVAIHPGSSAGTPHKRYAPADFARVARELHERDGVVSVVTCGPAPEDRALAESVARASGGAARVAPATPALRDLAALFASCRAVIGADTGPLQLAAALGTPVVQIVGPTDPVENAPHPSAPARQVSVGLPCSPCRRGCAAAPCMRVPPGEVAAAARALLRRGAAPARAETGA